MKEAMTEEKGLLLLRQILLEETDPEHPMSTEEMADRLAGSDIPLPQERVGAFLEALEASGLELANQGSGWFVEKREFELPELKLLVDAVQASRFITHRKSNQLIKKLEQMASRHQAVQLQRHVYVYGRIKTGNERIYANVDALHQAIAAQKKIAFLYYHYSPDKSWTPRQGGAPYVVSPYALCWQEENYYLIAHYPKYGGISHFRVDRMQEIRILEEPRESIRQVTGALDLNVALYTRGQFGMFRGRREQVAVRFHNSLMDVVVDRFGEEVDTTPWGEEHFVARMEVYTGPTFYGWLAMFGKKAEVLEPETVREELSQLAEELTTLYPTKYQG